MINMPTYKLLLIMFRKYEHNECQMNIPTQAPTYYVPQLRYTCRPQT